MPRMFGMIRLRFLLASAFLLLPVTILAGEAAAGSTESLLPDRIAIELAGFPAVAVSPVVLSPPSEGPSLPAGLGLLPLAFEPNRGQADAAVAFVSRTPGYAVHLTHSGVLIVLSEPAGAPVSPPAAPGDASGRTVRMSLLGSSPGAPARGLEILPGRVSYLKGSDPAGWRTNVPRYARVLFEEVYPGVDLIYHGSGGRLEYTFLVAAGADPRAIRIGFEGAEQIEVDPHGDLLIHTAAGPLRQHAPRVYQESSGSRREIAGRFIVGRDRSVGFEIGPYDVSLPLVIDPILSYSTYLGDSGNDLGTGIAVDAAGFIYVTGWTDSAAFPATAGAFQPLPGGDLDAFVVKLTPAGDSLIYATFIGGAGKEFEVIGIAVDGGGIAYITGITDSADFPTTPSAFQRRREGIIDVFVSALNADGSGLVYSTYLGGTGIDGSQTIAVDAASNVYVTGFTGSDDFPVTPGSWQTSRAGGSDAFVTKLNMAGSGLVFSTYLGGTGEEFATGLAIDAGGSVYVAGETSSADFPVTPGAFQTANAGAEDSFLTKLDPSGAVLAYSTYLGGSGADPGRDVAVDPFGNAHLAGITESGDFPTTAGAFQEVFGGARDVYVAKIDPTGSHLLYSTFLGGGGPEISRGIALDVGRHAFVTGSTNSPNFPVTAGAVQSSHAGGEDAFVAQLDTDGAALLFSTFLGGGGNDRAREIAVDLQGNVFVSGFTSSPDFPMESPIQGAYAGGPGNCFFLGGCDAFIAKLSADLTATVTVSSPVSSLSRGESLPFTVQFANPTSEIQELGFALLLTLPGGQSFLILPPQSLGMPPGATPSMSSQVGPIPADAPTGLWGLTALLILPSPTGPSIVALSRIEFTVNPASAATSMPNRRSRPGRVGRDANPARSRSSQRSR